MESRKNTSKLKKNTFNTMNKTITIIILSIQLLLLPTLINAQKTAKNNAIIQKIDNYLNAGTANGFSGSVLIAKKGEIILNKGYGLADKESNKPYTPTTISTIGSVTKQFTATAILKLVAMKKLKLTDPLSRFFTKLPKDKRKITIHQLLTHSAGMIDVIGDGDFDDIPMKRFFKTLFATKLLHAPGSKYTYSNAGYSILARIIELTSGQEYEHFLNKQLFKPAGMTQTGYFMPQWDQNLIATGYARNVIKVGTMIARYNASKKITWTLKGNGGIHSTTGDMFKWYQALKSNKILSAALFEKLTTPYILEYDNRKSRYAYGWAIYNSSRNTKIISHNGGNAIFFHDFLWLPKEDVVILLFTNASSREVEVAWPIEKMFFDTAYKAAPIKKNLFQLVFDFMKNNEVQAASKLTALIKENYSASIKNSGVLNDLGYRLIEMRKEVAWAISLFKLNTTLFPKNGNVWDSLGEAYAKNDQKKEAIKSYQKALEFAPRKDCDWCKGSVKALRTLRNTK